MRILIASLLALLLTAGCTSVIREEYISGSTYPSLSHYYDHSLIVDIDLSHEKIIRESTYIIDPKGNKYEIIVKPHQYDIDKKHPTIRAAVYPVQENGEFLGNWMSGVWTFNFMLESKGAYRKIEQKKKYWTVCYPIFSPPN